MRRIIIAISLVCQILLLQGCITSNQSTDLAKYGLWKESTVRFLQENFSNSLPEAETVCKYGKSYYYKSTQGVMGDENFIIHVVIRFDEKTRYEEELSKYRNLLSNSVLRNDVIYYTIRHSNEAVLEYTNDEILDGMYYDFEIIAINEKECSMEFINAHVWDYYKNQVLIDFLQQIGGQEDREQGDGLRSTGDGSVC